MAKYLTKEGLENLKKELKDLETRGIKESAESIRYAASFGDLSENAAYSDAKDTQDKLLSRIAKIKGTIRDSVIIEKNCSDRVSLGSTVQLDCEGETEVYKILGEDEVDLAKGIISHKSPLGEKLMGKCIGDVVKLGIDIKYKIINIK
jgi:transcription elongation GreA/GreB family factor